MPGGQVFANHEDFARSLFLLDKYMDNNRSLYDLLGITPTVVKRKVFVSYHHDNDQYWHDSFCQTYSSQLSVFTDTSLDRKLKSEDAQYINSTIKEEHIRGSSITIVLIGTETWKRRWVDWEIHATLDERHALLGIALPPGYHAASQSGNVIVPDRFYDNHQSGYAHFIHWPNNYQVLNSAIETAIAKSKNGYPLVNTRQKMLRSKS